MSRPICFPASVEGLENRFLFAASPQIDFADFSSTTHLVGNGFGGSSITSGNHLRLTDGGLAQKRSVWFDTSLPIDQFTTHFSFQSDASNNTADGLTFTIQNGPTSALGIEGLNLGYTGIDHSEAVAFNLYNFHHFGSQFGFASNGQIPPTDTDMSPVDLHSGHVFDATVTYDGSALHVTVTDESDHSKTFSASKMIDLPATIGSDSAIVGFTAATGDHFSTQDILGWDFTGTPSVSANDPSITSAAAATPSPVVGKFTNLSVLADDAGGEANLIYTWSTLKKPSGAKDPIFSENGTNAAKAITARFSKDGTFRFRVTVTNKSGGSATGDVSVVVQQTASNLRINPHKAQVPRGTTLKYRATVLDQFNHILRTQPPITFAMVEGPGTITPSGGLFTASDTDSGHFVISVTAGTLIGQSAGTVT